MNKYLSDKYKSFYNKLAFFYPIISFVDTLSRVKSLEMCELREGDKVLCVGIGSGKELNYFISKKCDVLGLDISDKVIKKYGRGVSQIGDMRELEFKNNSFDLIYSSFTIDLFCDSVIEKILDKLYKIVKPDGRVVLVCNCEESGVAKSLVGLYKIVSKLYPVRNRVIDIEKLAHHNGFDVLSKKKVQHAAECVVLRRHRKII
jgi:ubiquinone/menaquinone biosynthesis C-methylase UbiE